MNPFEIEQKIKQLTRRVCCAISQIEPLDQDCINEGSTPHTSVDFGDSGGELLLTFSGGSGDNLSTQIQVFRSGSFITSDIIVHPTVTYVVSGQQPPTSGDEIIVLYRATCEGVSDGDGNWKVGYYQTDQD